MSYSSFRHWLLVIALLCGYPLRAQSSAPEPRLLLIEDAESGEAIVGVRILVGKISYLTGLEGTIDLNRIKGLSPSTRLEISSIGYRSLIIRHSELKRTGKIYRVRLHPDVRELSTLTINADRKSVSVNAVSRQVGANEIARSMGSSLAAILQEVSGVSMLQNGTTVAKPIIQGMYGNRILIVNNGVRQSGQQWGDDHAPELDMSSSHSIQVVKGADAVRYGAEALGGIILMEQKRLPYGVKSVRGSLGTLYATNGRRSSSMASVEGSLLGGEWAYRLQGSYTNAGDRSTARYILNNTGVREQNFSTLLGWKRKAWEVELLYSRYDSRGGILRSAQLRNRDQMAELLSIGQPLTFTPFSRKIDYPYHHVIHHTATLKANHKASWGKLYAQSSWQRDERKEYAIRRNNNSHFPTLALNLTSLQQLLRWEHSYATSWQTEAGGHYTYTNNYNTPGTGVVPVIPNYVDYTLGFFGVQKYQRRLWGAELGLRVDHQRMKALGYDIFGDLYGGPHQFTNITYSLGGHYRLGEYWRLTTNLGLAWRAPHVHELYSQGQQHGSATYVIGKPDLKSELSHKWITSLSYQSHRVRLQLDAYLQWIDGYIYDEPTKEIRTTISGDYPVFLFQQRDAFFRGVDLDLSLDLIADLSYRIVGSMVWANERNTGRYFPYIPALRVDQEVGWRPSLGSSTSSFELSVKHRFVDKQRRFDPETDLTNSPPAYHLVGLEASYSWLIGKRQELELALSSDNLLNKQYKDYTNRARYYSHDAGRDVRLSLRWTF